jgi:ADP-heptose:LPS heptosyltransferase
MYPSTEEKAESRRILQSLGWDPARPTFGIHLGAGKKQNRWPCEHFVALAALMSRQGYQVVVMWGPRESDLAETFRSFDQTNALYVNPIPLRLLGGLFQQLTAVVVNDTGMLHLAASCGTPLVALFGPTPPEEWCPIGSQFLWVRGPENKTSEISVDSVWAKLLTLLKPKD